MTKIKTQIISTVEKISKTNEILSNSMNSLEEIIMTLENIVQGNNRNKTNVLVQNVIDKSNKVLQSLACQADYENLPNFQFTITEIPNVDEDFEQCLEIKNTEDLVLHFSTYFGEELLDDKEDARKNGNNKNNNKKNKNNSDKIAKKCSKAVDSIEEEQDFYAKNSKPIQILKRQDSISNISKEVVTSFTSSKSNTVSNNYTKNRFNETKLEIISVHISHIKNPQDFYVQNDEFKSNFTNLQNQCKMEAGISMTVSYIDEDEIYLVKSAGSWHRGQVIKKINSNLCKVLLIDTGMTLNISANCFKIIPDTLQEIPAGAQKCSIYGIKPKRDHWTDENNVIVSEVTADQIIQMVIVKKEKKQYLVDLIAVKTTPTSLRDALIYTDNADTFDILDDKILIQNLVQYNKIKQKLIPPITKSFYETDLKLRIETPIIALNVISPDEFYATKLSDEENIERMQKNLLDMYKKGKGKANSLLVPRENMPCAVKIEGQWFRAKVVSIDSKAKCEVHLVDFGDFKQVAWKQLKLLDEKFLQFNAYSFQCSLIDIEPIKGVEWSTDAVKEFKRFCQSSNLLIFMNHCNSAKLAHKVVLYIAKPNMDLNVNAMMVRAKHAISTGLDSERIEYPKENIKIKQRNTNSVDDVILNFSSKKTKIINDISAGSRKIRMVHIVSPGEFYINLESYIDSIQNLQKEIKITQDRKIKENPDFAINHEWKLDENCLALVNLLNNDSEKWYRAKIVNINEDENYETLIYSVYLRDYGLTINKLEINKISPIDDSLNRIIDNALRCSLACSKATGDLPSWSKSSIDYFKDLAKQYENSLYASIYGDRNKNNSIPVILWAKITEMCNPLSSDTFRWCNLNKQLVNGGYAHSTGSLKNTVDNKWKDIMDDFEKTKVERTKINSKELIFVEEVFEFTKRNHPTSRIALNSTEQLDFTECQSDTENINDWLPPKPIAKSIFTGVPTYVDDDANIYLHDNSQTENLNKIKSFINKKFNSNLNTSTKSINWQVGAPCVARYHLDNCFYRAKVVECLPNKNYKVLFVDYGDVEECTENSLIKEICLTKVPIQANIYRLGGIMPCSGKWTRPILDFIHFNIVLKHCTIRVDVNSMTQNDLVKKCSISTSDIGDLGDLLIRNEFVIKKKEGFLTSKAGKNILKAIHGNLQEDSYSETEEELLSRFDDSKIEKEPVKFYQDLFAREEFMDLQKSDKLSDDEDDLNDLTYHSGRWQHSRIISGEIGEKLLSDDEDEIKRSDTSVDNFNILTLADEDIVQLNLPNKNVESDSTVNSFNPKETSTVVSRFDGLEYFARCELPSRIRGFYCEINFIRSSLNFFISPILKEQEKNFQDMSRSIQSYVKLAKPMEEPIELRKPCLAMFSEDNLWYRALIRSKNRTKGEYDVMYVDFMNMDSLKVDKLLKIPKMYLKYPLRLIEVQMQGLKPNERWRENDINRRLTELLINKKVYCKIKKMGRIPKIKFYESSSCKKLFLQPMIDEKYYSIDK